MKLFFILLTLPIFSSGFPVEAESHTGKCPTPKPTIYPDVIDSMPNNTLTIKYDRNQVTLGNELTPKDVENPPTAMEWKVNPENFYFLSMTDPEANNFIHWMVGNIPGTNVEKGDLLADYVGSGPRNGTGLHRYVFLVFEQPGKLVFDEPKMPAKIGSINLRLNFNQRKFSDKYNLGKPYAANFYLTKWDEYVPILFAKLSAGQ